MLEEIESLREREFGQLVVFSDVCLYDHRADLQDERVTIVCKKGVWNFGGLGSGGRAENMPCREDCDGRRPDGAPEDGLRKELAAKLSDREREILGMIGRGLTSREIAERLFISKRTVDHHRQNILRKLELTGLTQLIALAVKFIAGLPE